MSELVKADAYTAAPLADRMQYAKALASAPIIPKALRRGGPDGFAETAANVLLVFETGSMLGIHPIAALQSIHVVEGKATLSAQLMNSLVRKAGHRVDIEERGEVKLDGNGKITEQSDYAVRVTVTRGDDGTTATSTWNYSRAKRAKLLGKDNWTNYFEAMATSRAISEACRQGAPDALMGVVYTAEELGAPVNSDGEIVDMPATNAPPAQPTPAQQPIQLSDEQLATRDEWVQKIDDAKTVDDATRVYHEARNAGVMHLPVDYNGETIELGQYIIKTGEALKLAAQQAAASDDQSDENVVDAEVVEDEPADAPAALDETI